MKLSHLLLTSCLLFPTIAVASSCKAPSKLHEEKMAKYALPTFPSLLEDCGLNDLLGKFGGELFKSFKMDLPDISICGYNTKDMASWFGVDYDGSVGVDVGTSYDFGGALSPSDLADGATNLFDSNQRLQLDDIIIE